MKPSKGMIGRAKKSLLGRIVCRLAGDQKGAVMMEYVIVAVLIAAACVVAVAMFGKTVVGMFGVGATGMTGKHSDAKAKLDTVEQTTKTDIQAAEDYHDGMHN